MTICTICNEAIEDGTLHACRAPSLRAPWLRSMLDAANKPLLDELARIRQLLEQQNGAPKQPAAETEANRRETR